MGPVSIGLRYRRKPRPDEPKLNREIKRLARRYAGADIVEPMPVGPARIDSQRQTGEAALERLGAEKSREAAKRQEVRPEAGGRANSCVLQPARFKNEVWTCDFIHDRTAEGRSLKWLTLVDEYTRECLVLHADGALAGAEVRQDHGPSRRLARSAGRRRREQYWIGIHMPARRYGAG